jgi:hypothetical protein
MAVQEVDKLRAAVPAISDDSDRCLLHGFLFDAMNKYNIPKPIWVCGPGIPLVASEIEKRTQFFQASLGPQCSIGRFGSCNGTQVSG